MAGFDFWNEKQKQHLQSGHCRWLTTYISIDIVWFAKQIIIEQCQQRTARVKELGNDARIMKARSYEKANMKAF